MNKPEGFGGAVAPVEERREEFIGRGLTPAGRGEQGLAGGADFLFFSVEEEEEEEEEEVVEEEEGGTPGGAEDGQVGEGEGPVREGEPTVEGGKAGGGAEGRLRETLGNGPTA